MKFMELLNLKNLTLENKVNNVVKTGMPPEAMWWSLEKRLQMEIWAERLGVEPRAIPIILEWKGAFPFPWEKVGFKIPKKLFPLMGKNYRWVLFLHSLGWEIDWLRKVANENLVFMTDSNFMNKTKEFIKAHNKRTLVRLLIVRKKNMQGMEIDSKPYLQDTVENWFWLSSNAPEALEDRPRIKDIFQYHDWLYKAKVDLEPSFELPVNQEVKNLIGPTFEEFEVVFPTETKILKEWGEKLQHCVGGYGHHIKSGQSIVFALYKEREPIYTIELKPGYMEYTLSQFYGIGNSEAPKDLKDKMVKIIS